MKNRGDILVSVLVFAAVAVTVVISLTKWGGTVLSNIRNLDAREQAFQIAEAGINYYQWHLAQSPNDYQDGTSTPGPYVHNFYDKNSVLLGTYTLTITPPPTGSTIVTILSVGKIASSTVSRSIQAKMAIPSLVKFAAIANDNMYFGSGTTVYGPVQSNKGIHFNGFAQNLVSSAVSTYVDPDTGRTEFGVYTDLTPADPTPPATVPNRTDVFAAGRQFPVPAFDFTGLTAGLTQLQTLAQSAGKEWTASGGQGYHMVFRVSGGTTVYDMYKVIALQSTPNNCGTDATARTQSQWGTWTIKSVVGSTQSSLGETLLGTYSVPSNGVIFVDDNLWVDGTIDNARMTIVAGIIGATSNYPSITVNTNLQYTNLDGTDAIGLISQGNINAGLVSDDTYEIDAALVAENGRVGRYYYNTSCSITTGSGHSQQTIRYYERTEIDLLGMIASAVRYGFAYTDGTGYDIRNINYDSNLLYGPPPSFPQATTQYQIISWQQLN